MCVNENVEKYSIGWMNNQMTQKWQKLHSVWIHTRYFKMIQMDIQKSLSIK
jgi:hypothetical protein